MKKALTPTIFFLLFLLLSSSYHSYAQKRSRLSQADVANLQELIENIAENNEDADIDFDTYFERLSDYLDTPVDLNKATVDDLMDIGLLSLKQANDIVAYREQMGDFIAIYELQAIPALDLTTIRQIAPFVRAKKLEDFNATFKDLFTKGRANLYLRYRRILEKQKGYRELDTIYQLSVLSPDSLNQEVTYDAEAFDTLNLLILDTLDKTPFSQYKGDQNQLYMRYRYNWGSKISYGFTAEKDPGEEFFRGSQKQGFDFYSAHFYLRDIGRFKHIALGDYSVRFGQGLVVWTGLGFRKGSYVMNISRQGNPLAPYTSVGEALFFRGAAATLGIGKNMEVTAFGSYRPIDGNISQLDGEEDFDINEIDDGNVSEVSSLQLSGLHRTEAEIADKNAISKADAGVNIAYKSRRFSLGASATYTKLGAALNPNDAPYNRYRFSGDQLMNASVDYKFLYRNFNFFGETAVSDNGGIATLNGVLMSLDPKVSMSVLYRYFSKKYQSLHANSFGEGSRPENERGLFFGTIISPLAPFKTIEITAYADVYRHEWLRSLSDAPSDGVDYLLQVAYNPSRKMNMYVRYRSETKTQNAPDNETYLDFLSNHTRSSFRYDLRYKATKAITLKSRVELTWYDDGTEAVTDKGYMLYQDIIFKPLSSPFSFATRFALFETETYGTRIYAYENDLPFTFNVPPYYNKGSRFYLMVRYNVSRNISTWLRFAQTHFADQQTFGSGNEEIDGNVRSEIKAMVKLKF